MSPTTPELRAMLDAATPGPWATQHDEWENDESIPCEVFSVIAGGDAILETTNFDPATHNPTANTTLAALAPDLAAELLRLREMRQAFADLAADLAQIGLEYRTGAYGQVDLLAAKLYEEVDHRLRALLDGEQS